MSTSPETVTAAALRARLETEAITLLDVRRHADAVADPAGIPGAVWRDPSNIDDWADTLPRDRPVALYCVRGGGVSQGAADALAAKGHAVLRLEGGLEAWKKTAAEAALIQPDELALLRQAGLPEKVISHSQRVTATALWLADQVRDALAVDRHSVRRGAVFHDLGKAEDGGVLHGVIGARIGRGLGLEESVRRTMEVHVRGGVPAAEAEAYGLPPGDYRPETLEQKLVVLADKLTDVVEAGKAATAAEALAHLDELLHRHPALGKDAGTTARILGLAADFMAARQA